MNHTTVLVIGAGPVGLILACELARRNIACRIIDHAIVAPGGSRAKALQPRSLEILNGLGIAEELMPVGYTELPFRKYNDNQLLGETPRNVFPRTDTRYPKTLLLPQYKVEEALRSKLNALGGNVEWATDLADFTQTNSGITCRLEHPNWTEELTCTYMVACDGGKSTTRKKLGIPFVGETHQEEQLWVGDVEVDGLAPDAWYNWLSPVYGIAFALFPFKNSNSWQVQAVAVPGADGSVPMPTLESFNQLFKERTQMQGVTFTNSTWQSVYRVNVRRAERYREGNIFIAGEACHVHSIAGGMGMNTGIQDAHNLAWKLAAVITGQAGDALLDTYAEERIPIADWLLQTTSERQRIMISGAKSGKGAFETLATTDTTQLNLHYHNSSLTVQSPPLENGLQPGDRAPDVQLTGGAWLSEKLAGTEWKLLVLGSIPLENIKGVKAVHIHDEAVIKAYGLPGGLVLIRPDGYISLITTNPNDVHEYWQKHFNK